MSLAALMAQLREAAASAEDRSAFEEEIRAALRPAPSAYAGEGAPSTSGEASGAGRPREDSRSPSPSPRQRSSRRARPPVRLSPEVGRRTRRQRGSPPGDPTGRAPPPPASGRGPRPGRNPRKRPGSAERGRPGLRARGSPPPSSHHSHVAAAGSPGDAPVGGGARRPPLSEGRPGRSRRSPVRAGRREEVPSTDTVGCPPGQRPGQSGPRNIVTAGGPGAPAPVHQCRSCGSRSSPAPSAQEADDSATSSRGVRHGDPGPSAGGYTAPGQPGELAPVMSSVSDMFSGGVGDRVPTVSGYGGVGGGGAPSDSAGWQDLLSSFRAFLAAGVRGPAGGPSPVSAWADARTSTGGSSVEGAGSLGGVAVAVQTEKDREVDWVRMDDRAHGEVYVCFEGPLGAHLKQEVRDKIGRDEYVEIFSLLPLEKFNLDKGKRFESKKEEEEKRRWRLIPQSFSNWLQAFAILASVIGEKAPHNCSALFCYLDSIGEAYRVYGGQFWLRYDEQFRQRKAVRPSIRWDQKDIGLWLRVMGSARFGQPFQGGAGSAGQAGSTGQASQSGGGKSGLCWLFNEGQCKYGAACKFKHVCGTCGGTSHGTARCFRKGRGRGGSGSGQGGDTGEGGRDAAVSRQVPG